VKILEYKDKAMNDDYYFHNDTYYHNKTIVVDKKLIYMGSSNFDPRSDFLNIELGLFIDSDEFAQQVGHYIIGKRTIYFGLYRVTIRIKLSGYRVSK
jgi:putative cardiolipin synthase